MPLVVVALAGLWLMFRIRRRRRRNFSADVVGQALGQVKPYKGPRWRVGERWL